MAKPTKKNRAEKAKLLKPSLRTRPKTVSKRPSEIVAKVNDSRNGRDQSAHVLDRLWSVVASRRDADPSISHSARLLSRGTEKVAQKFGEEAVECLIEAVAGNREAVVAESADVLYHLIVLWVSADVSPDEVWAELKRREGVSGIVEKASRVTNLPAAFGLETTKIP